MLSQLKVIARTIYSNPPIHGARIVSEVVGDESMFGEWKQEMEYMAGRIKACHFLQPWMLLAILQLFLMTLRIGLAFLEKSRLVCGNYCCRPLLITRFLQERFF